MGSIIPGLHVIVGEFLSQSTDDRQSFSDAILKQLDDNRCQISEKFWRINGQNS